METSKQYQIPILTPWIKMTLHKNTNKTFWLSTNTFSRKRKITVFTRFYHTFRWVTCVTAHFWLKIIKYWVFFSQNDCFESIVIWNFSNWLSHNELLISDWELLNLEKKLFISIRKLLIFDWKWVHDECVLCENDDFESIVILSFLNCFGHNDLLIFDRKLLEIAYFYQNWYFQFKNDYFDTESLI